MNKEKEVVDVEAVGDVEQKPSAWIERTSAGKLKYGCKTRCDTVSGACEDVYNAFVDLEKKMDVYENKRSPSS